MKHHLLILYIYEYITLLMQVYNESNMVVLSSIYKYCMLYFFFTVYMTVRKRLQYWNFAFYVHCSYKML